MDIDDTLSTSGKLTPKAYASLWKLKNAGFTVVPITGRPAGWCDHIARFWPVDAVVGENGAFVFYMKDGKLQRLNTPAGIPINELKTSLDQLAVQIQRRYPGVKWASDQPYREFDLAVDVCEDVKPWSKEQVDDLLRFCADNGAHAKLSSIHVNIWFGNYDKRSGFLHWVSQGFPGCEPKAAKSVRNMNRWIYIGDSPNDEPMFASFKKSVGVANLKAYLDRLKTHPTWITSRKSGDGFQEMANRLILGRS